MKQNTDKPQLPKHIVRFRNLMKSQKHKVNLEGGKTAHIAGFFEWKCEFKMSKSTFYKYIKEFEALDENFWYDKHCSYMMFYET